MAARRAGHGVVMLDAGRSALVQQSRNRSDGNREYGGRGHSRRTGHLAILSQARGSTVKRRRHGDFLKTTSRRERVGGEVESPRFHVASTIVAHMTSDIA